jgi:hypothetical protein
MHKELEQDAARPGSLDAELEAVERQLALLQSRLRMIRGPAVESGSADPGGGRPPT